MDLAIGRSYTVNLTATDSTGFGAIIIVDITVTESSMGPYDRNSNDRIDRDEVLRAVSDYFKGLVEKDEVIGCRPSAKMAHRRREKKPREIEVV